LSARIVWSDPVRDAFLGLPEREQVEIAAKLDLLQLFPRMYAMQLKGRFRRHRKFVAGNWAVYYRVVENIVYVRGLWPARLPLKLMGRR
jgi:hypothetical protein